MTTLPPFVRTILQTLETAGHAAYLVGGPVRNIVMGTPPEDWDIATDATPDTVQILFPKTIPTGLRHGTVTVVTDGGRAEVTTFRRDGTYTDHRRPEQVNFVTGLEEDLARRDFTINAMALDLRGVLTDPFDGKADIAAGRIRAVGDPAIRFTEDALRMFRAFRFSAQLGFVIDSAIMTAIRAKNHLAQHLSAERVRDELEKILLSDLPERLAEFFVSDLLTGYAASGHPPPLLQQIGQVPAQKHLRWTAFAAILAEGGAIASPEAFLKALRLDNKTISIAATGATLAPRLSTDAVKLKRLLAHHGEKPLICAAAVAALFGTPSVPDTLNTIRHSGDCYSLETLAITGADLIAANLAAPGPALGTVLARLLDHVIMHPSENKRDTLLALAAQCRRNA